MIVCPSSVKITLKSAMTWAILNSAVCDWIANASLVAPSVSFMFAKIASVPATFLPIRSITPERARTLPNTDAAAAELSPNSSESVFNVDKRPFSLSCSRRPSEDKPISVRASSASFVGRKSDDMIPRTCVAASAAFVPVRESEANAAPTSSKLTPIAEAIGKTRPIEPASSEASNLPSRTAATITSVAFEALRFSLP